MSSLELTDFRNYAQVSAKLDSGLNLFLGRNAQGKTNLLEAVYVASAGRSYRASRDAELIRWGQSHFRICASIERKPVPMSLEVSFSHTGQRLVRLNGCERVRAAELSSYLNVVMFTPDDLALVKGSPADRRKFLDLEISQISPTYRSWVSTYAKAVSQRNALLKQAAAGAKASGFGASGGNRIGDLLEAWDEQIVDAGSRITARRAEVIESLAVLGRIAHRKITGTKEILTMRYVPSIPLECSASVSAIAELFRARLKELRRAELARCVTLAGPHRDDLVFEIDGMDVASFGSQGQQRSTVLSVKMAEVEFIRSRVGDEPVLLLDDVLSELDEVRRAHLLSEVVGRHQTLVTSVEPDAIRMMPGSARVFQIHAGEVTGFAPPVR
ncbi:MAG: DNA replication/repair protein RecF [Clostridia bacterium]|nr:DNA replication/repair protein RecF [Clostridia bacterium]